MENTQIVMTSMTPGTNEFPKDLKNGYVYMSVPALMLVGIHTEDGYSDKHYVIGCWCLNPANNKVFAFAGANEHGVNYTCIEWAKLPDIG